MGGSGLQNSKTILENARIRTAIPMYEFYVVLPNLEALLEHDLIENGFTSTGILPFKNGDTLDYMECPQLSENCDNQP